MNWETTDKRIVHARNMKVYNNKYAQCAFRKPTSIRYVTGTRYLEHILEVQVYRSSVVSKQSYKMIRHVTFG